MTSSSTGGSETYTSGTSTPSLGSKAPTEAVPAPKFEEEEDDLSAPVPVGTKCRHNGCKVEYESDELHRKEGGEAAECTYHPKPVSRSFTSASVCTFVELLGSLFSTKVARYVFPTTRGTFPSFSLPHRGYLCCKRRVLEFDEFLKIEGCKKGRHVFVPKAKANSVSRLEADVSVEMLFTYSSSSCTATRRDYAMPNRPLPNADRSTRLCLREEGEP